MNILLLGSGGREHTLAWKLTQSPHCTQLLVAPGNAGTGQCAQNVNVGVTDFDAIKSLVLERNIDMVIVGPEAPLVAGIYDFFQQDEMLKSCMVIGPSAEAAQLEGSKAYAKKMMQEQGIPTASYQEFSAETRGEGLAYLDQHTLPIVLKADGLAAGKGVLILNDREEAKQEFEAMLDGKFGAASATIVVEQFLKGLEFSVFVITDGKDYQILPVAKDYKRIGEGDTGLNTGGMGAVSPVPFVDAEMMEKVRTRIIEPTMKGLQDRSLDYKGFIFFGLIEVNGEPYVIEYNCRMGDPETEVVIPRLENDLVELCAALYSGKLSRITIEQKPQSAATIMLVSGGYPQAYEKGKAMSGFDQATNSMLFHAGTRGEGRGVVTNGGRVLAITSFGESLEEALHRSKANAEKIEFEGKYYRTDIGFDVLPAKTKS